MSSTYEPDEPTTTTSSSNDDSSSSSSRSSSTNNAKESSSSTDLVKHKYTCDHDIGVFDNCQICGRVHCTTCYLSPVNIKELNITVPFQICSSCRHHCIHSLCARIPPVGTIIAKCSQHTPLTLPTDSGILNNCKVCLALSELYRLLMIESTLTTLENIPLYGYGEKKTNIGKATAVAIPGLIGTVVSAGIGSVTGLFGGAITGALAGGVFSSAKAVDTFSTNSNSGSTTNSSVSKKSSSASTPSTPSSTTGTPPPAEVNTSTMMTHAKAILKMTPEEQQQDAEKEQKRIKDCKSLYEILELPKTATLTEIKAAHRAKSMAYHPDRNSSPLANDLSQAINNAYAVLGDEEKKTKYDSSGGKDTSGVDVTAGTVNIDIKVGRKGAAIATATGIVGAVVGLTLGAVTGALAGTISGVTGTLQYTRSKMIDHIKAEDTMKNRISIRRTLLNKEAENLLKSFRTIGITLDPVPVLTSSSSSNPKPASSLFSPLSTARLTTASQIIIQNANVLTSNDGDDMVTTSSKPSIVVQISVPYDITLLSSGTKSNPSSSSSSSSSGSSTNELQINRFTAPEIQQDLELVVNDVFLRRMIGTVNDEDKEYTARFALAKGDFARAQRTELGIPEPQGPTEDDYNGNNNNTHVTKDATGISGGDDYETRLAAETVDIKSMQGLWDHAIKESEKQAIGMRAEHELRTLAVLGARAEALSMGKEPREEWLARRAVGIVHGKENDDANTEGRTSSSSSTKDKPLPLTNPTEGWTTEEKEEMKIFETRWKKVNQLGLRSPYIIMEMAVPVVSSSYYPVRTISLYEKQRKFRISSIPEELRKLILIDELEKQGNPSSVTVHLRLRLIIDPTVGGSSSNVSSSSSSPTTTDSHLRPSPPVTVLTFSLDQLKTMLL